MSLKKSFYFCCECKNILPELDDLLFIDETSNKGFCSEDCIEDFYFPLIKYYEMLVSSLKEKHRLPDEGVASEDLIDETLENPSEVYRLTNELHDSFYHFIKHYSGFSVVVVSSVYRKEASFVFLSVKTASQKLVGEFRYGEKLEDFSESKDSRGSKNSEDSHDDPFEMESETLEDNQEEDMQFIQLLESKKSSLLADILMKRKESDIPFEDYSGYESCFQETLDFPDEVFERKDKEGDVIFSYIKSFSNFFYIVTCLKRHDGRENVNVYPILALPTTDMEMCQEFRGGVRLTGPLKN